MFGTKKDNSSESKNILLMIKQLTEWLGEEMHKHVTKLSEASALTTAAYCSVSVHNISNANTSFRLFVIRDSRCVDFD